MARTDKQTFADKAAGAWGQGLSDEVRELATYADANSAAAAAKLIGYSPAVVSCVFAATYKGDMPAVIERIRGALLGHTVVCPVLGEIGRNLCIVEQGRPFATSNSARARVYRACRSGCPNSRLRPEGASRSGQPGKDAQ